MKRNSKKMVKKSSKKGLLNMFVLLLFVIFIFIIFSNVNAKKYYETKKIVVGDKDTLWSIADRITKNNDEVSVYTVINDIKEINDLDDSIIYEGQILNVYKY